MPKRKGESAFKGTGRVLSTGEPQDEGVVKKMKSNNRQKKPAPRATKGEKLEEEDDGEYQPPAKDSDIDDNVPDEELFDETIAHLYDDSSDDAVTDVEDVRDDEGTNYYEFKDENGNYIRVPGTLDEKTVEESAKKDKEFGKNLARRKARLAMVLKRAESNAEHEGREVDMGDSSLTTAGSKVEAYVFCLAGTFRPIRNKKTGKLQFKPIKPEKLAVLEKARLAAGGPECKCEICKIRRDEPVPEREQRAATRAYKKKLGVGRILGSKKKDE